VRAAYRLDMRGTERIPPTGPIVVVANHESVLDPLVLGAVVPRPLHFLAKEELWRYPLVGAVLDRLGGIRVARGRGDRDAICQAGAVLDRGGAVAIFPEGGVRRSGPWLRGAARLALASGAPIVPVRLLGTAAALSPSRVGFPRLAVIVGDPVLPPRAQATVAAARVLTASVQEAVAALGT
jgi:1-acyl-sn-glycerol-3-phosphate acyltransferase